MIYVYLTVAFTVAALPPVVVTIGTATLLAGLVYLGFHLPVPDRRPASRRTRRRSR